MIKGWSDVVRFPRLGEIRLGEKDERGVPRALDYFVVPPEVQEIYGPQPRELDIMFPHEDLEVVMPSALKRYGDQWGLICRGDGETATLSLLYARKAPQEYGLRLEGGRFLSQDGEVLPVLPGDDGRGWVQIPCPYKECPHYKGQKCREVVLVNVLLPKVPGVLGVYTIATGSFHSYTNIRNALGMLKAMVGRISFIPLKLRIRMQDAHPEVGDKRIKRAVPVMYIDMTGMNLERMIELAREERLALVHRSPVQVQAVDIEPPDENEKPELLYPPVQEPPALTAPAETPQPEQERQPEPAATAHSTLPMRQRPENVGAGLGQEAAGSTARREDNGSQSARTQVQPNHSGNNGEAQETAAPQPQPDLRKQVLEMARRLPVERQREALAAVIGPFATDEVDQWLANLPGWVAGASEDDLEQFQRYLAIQMLYLEAGDMALVERVVRSAGITIGDVGLEETLAELEMDVLRQLFRAVREAKKNAQQASGSAAAGAARTQTGGQTGQRTQTQRPETEQPVEGEFRLTRTPSRDAKGSVMAGALAVKASGLRQNLAVNLMASGEAGETLTRIQVGQVLWLRGKVGASNVVYVQEVRAVAPVAS